MSNPPHFIKPAHLLSLSALFHNELHLLDRIYYKNQSQFHLNLFWRKVTEVRRIGGKVKDAWELYKPFVNGKTESTDERARRNGLKRLAVLVEKVGLSLFFRSIQRIHFLPLLSKLHLALPKLHTALSHTIQLTHFLPVVVVLLGITARLWTTSFALYDHLQILWDTAFKSRKGKGLRSLPFWTGPELGIEHGQEKEKDTSGPSSVAELKEGGQDDPELGQVIHRKPALPVSIDSPSSELGEVIQRRPPPVSPFSSIDTGDKIERDYFSLPIASNANSPPSSPAAASSPSDLPTLDPPPIHNPLSTAKLSLLKPSTIPTVSSPLSRPSSPVRCSPSVPSETIGRLSNPPPSLNPSKRNKEPSRLTSLAVSSLPTISSAQQTTMKSVVPKKRKVVRADVGEQGLPKKVVKKKKKKGDAIDDIFG